VSPVNCTPEQFERWHKRTCARCGRFGYFAAVWPDGSVCRTCECRALRNCGQCPGCGEQRLLPGRRDGDDAAICTRCAGFRPSYACSRCGQESELHARRLCTRCTLSDRLAALLDDGTGSIRRELVPLHAMLTAVDNPRTGLNWLHGNPPNVGAAANLLRGLGTGEIALTHDAFHRLQPWRAAAHLRDLLMRCGLLPKVDKQLCLFERWLVEHLDGIAESERQQIVHRFATWHILPRLRSRAERKAITPAGRGFAGDQVAQATRFFGWLADRGLGLADCRQADIDAWHAEHKQHDRVTLRAFLLWCMESRLVQPLTLPTARSGHAAPLTSARRIELLGQVLVEPGAPLRSRVAAGLLLLYAQPVSRIVRLSLDDILEDDGQVLIRLGEPPSPVPEPFATLLLDYVARRANMRTATNPGSTWLFPGRRADQPLRPEYLAKLIHRIGVPTVASRGAAIRQHLLDMPAPIVADALGYHHTTTTRLAAQAGTTWSRYAPGDHTPSSPPRTRDG
jgi:integrase